MLGFHKSGIARYDQYTQDTYRDPEVVTPIDDTDHPLTKASTIFVSFIGRMQAEHPVAFYTSLSAFVGGGGIYALWLAAARSASELGENNDNPVQKV